VLEFSLFWWELNEDAQAPCCPLPCHCEREAAGPEVAGGLRSARLRARCRRLPACAQAALAVASDADGGAAETALRADPQVLSLELQVARKKLVRSAPS